MQAMVVQVFDPLLVFLCLLLGFEGLLLREGPLEIKQSVDRHCRSLLDKLGSQLLSDMTPDKGIEAAGYRIFIAAVFLSARVMGQVWLDSLFILLEQVGRNHLVRVGFGIPVVLGLVAELLELVFLFIYESDLLGLTELPHEVVSQLEAEILFVRLDLGFVFLSHVIFWHFTIQVPVLLVVRVARHQLLEELVYNHACLIL